MLGHAKTVLVLLMGWAFQGDTVSQVKLIGVIMAVAGMILYSYFAIAMPPRSDPSAALLPLSKRDKTEGGLQEPLIK